MIRVAAIAGVFFAVTLTLILSQKDNQPRSARAVVPPGSTETSQAAPAPDTPAPDTAKPEPAATPQTTTTPDDQDVARNQGGLAYLDSPDDGSQPRNAALPDPRSAAPSGSAQVMEDSEALEALIASAMAQGQSPAYIAALIQNGGQSSTHTPAPQLVSNGRVDAAQLVGALTARAAKDRPEADRLTYTVRPGDTLAAIAFRFYGDTARRGDIAAANADSLGQATHLTIGQRLVIPSL